MFPLQRIACYSNCASYRMIHMKTFVFYRLLTEIRNFSQENDDIYFS